jgi:hypothetical protein
MTTDYIEDQQGNLRFTQQGRENLAPLFAMAGISIDSIKTKTDYLLARQACEPYFMEYLAQKTANWPDTLIYRCMGAAIFGTQEEFLSLLDKLERREKLSIV